jgi:hypothetical protein
MTTQENANRVVEGEKGAVMIEAAVVFPLLFMLIFATLEFSWAFTMRTVVQNAADEAMSLASVTHGIDYDDYPGAPYADGYNDAIERVKDRAWEVVRTAGFKESGDQGGLWMEEPEVNTPPSTPLIPRRESLETSSMSVRLRAHVPVNMLFLKSVEVDVTTIGYRDYASDPLMPRAMDENGSQIASGASSNCYYQSDPGC